MPDNIERVVQRDLDQLPLLPPERWIPSPKQRGVTSPSWLRPLALVPATLLIMLAAVAAGTQLADWRAQRESAAGQAGIAPGDSPTLPTGWSIHDAAGLRIAAPAAWFGPEVLPALDATGPRAWVVFRDPSGGEALTLMTWRDATASSLASAQFQSELPKGDAPQQLNLVEGTQTRTVVAMSGYAHWSDAGGAGTYECRYLYVQVDPTLVAQVIACGAHVRGSSTPTPELRRTQEQVALRLGVAGGPP